MLLALFASALAADGQFDFSGDLRSRGTLTTFPDDSLFHDPAGSASTDFTLLGRLKFAWDKDNWDLRAAYQARD